MRVVNGYFCQNCADELLAKKGLDPAKVKQDGATAVQASERGQDGRKLAAGSTPKQTEYGVNQPDPSRDVGARVSLYV